MTTTIDRKMDSLLAFHNLQNPALPICFLDLLPDFPLCSVENFHKFCNDLNENEELRKQFVSIKLFLLKKLKIYIFKVIFCILNIIAKEDS